MHIWSGPIFKEILPTSKEESIISHCTYIIDGFSWNKDLYIRLNVKRDDEIRFSHLIEVTQKMPVVICSLWDLNKSMMCNIYRIDPKVLWLHLENS